MRKIVSVFVPSISASTTVLASMRKAPLSFAVLVLCAFMTQAQTTSNNNFAPTVGTRFAF